MVDGFLRERGLRDKSEVTLLSPLNRAFTIQSASELIQPIMEQRDIGLTTFFNVETVDPSAGVVASLEGEEQEYDLLVLVPPHEGARVVIDSGLGDSGGWIPTDKHTLNVEGHDRIFALGDATNLPISKSGSTAHFEAPVIASRIAALVQGNGTEGELRRAGHVLPRDRRRQGHVTPLRLRASTGATTAQSRVARREVALQPHVLGHRAPGQDP